MLADCNILNMSFMCFLLFLLPNNNNLVKISRQFFKYFIYIIYNVLHGFILNVVRRNKVVSAIISIDRRYYYVLFQFNVVVLHLNNKVKSTKDE